MVSRKKNGSRTPKAAPRKKSTQTRRKRPQSVPDLPPMPDAGATSAAVAEAPRRLDSLSGVYEAVAAILVPYAKLFEAEMHPKIGYCLKAKHGQGSQKECYFGGVHLHQDHVSFHLFLLYSFPDLEAEMSSQLADCQKGVTSFEIEAGVSMEVVEELEQLTRQCFDRFRTEGLFGEVA